MKKLIALLLALVLCVAMACPAFAVEGDNATDTGTTFVGSNEEDPTPDDEGDQPVGPGDNGDEGLGVPETGDRSQENTALLAGLMGLSFAGIVGVSAVLWKNRGSSKA